MVKNVEIPAKISVRTDVLFADSRNKNSSIASFLSNVVEQQNIGSVDNWFGLFKKWGIKAKFVKI